MYCAFSYSTAHSSENGEQFFSSTTSFCALTIFYLLSLSIEKFLTIFAIKKEKREK